MPVSQALRCMLHQRIEKDRLRRHVGLEVPVHPAASFRVTHPGPVRSPVTGRGMSVRMHEGLQQQGPIGVELVPVVWQPSGRGESSLEARFGTTIQGKIRKRVLFTTPTLPSRAIHDPLARWNTPRDGDGRVRRRGSPGAGRGDRGLRAAGDPGAHPRARTRRPLLAREPGRARAPEPSTPAADESAANRGGRPSAIVSM